MGLCGLCVITGALCGKKINLNNLSTINVIEPKITLVSGVISLKFK